MSSQTQDRAAKARAALQRKFDELAGGDRVKADQLRREYYLELQRRSAAKRRQKRAARVAAENRLLEAQLGEKIMTEDEFVRILQDLGVMR